MFQRLSIRFYGKKRGNSILIGGIKEFRSSSVHLKIKKLCGIPLVILFQPRILYNIGIGRVLIE